jgi:hypothetical protein
MGALTFPTKFDNDMPWVHFQAFSYAFPSPDTAILSKILPKTATGDVIALYMPGDFTESADASWGLEETYRSIGNAGAWAAANVASGIQGTAEGAKVMSTAKATTGRLPFPTDVAVFQQISPLGFTLNFNMIPFDKEEGDSIVSIIQTFKKLQAPKVDGDTKNVLLKFPAIWDIQFVGINGLAYKDSKYENMALTHCSVSYVSGNEGASVYKDKNPTQIKLSVGFQGIQKFFLQ